MIPVKNGTTIATPHPVTPKNKNSTLDQAITDHAAKTLPQVKTPIQGPKGKKLPSRHNNPPVQTSPTLTTPEGIDKKTPPTLTKPEGTEQKTPSKPKKKPPGKRKSEPKEKTAHRGILYEFFTYLFHSIGYMILKLLGRK